MARPSLMSLNFISARLRIFLFLLKIIKNIYFWQHLSYTQCFGSGSGWICIIWPDPDPLQETLSGTEKQKKSWYTYIKINQNYKNIIFFYRNHLFSLIYVNNKLVNYKEKKTSLSFIHLQKYFFLKIGICSDPELNPEPDPDPLSRKRNTAYTHINITMYVTLY